ncbi:MAG: DsbA family protein [Pseudomonadota bacterium]
MRIHFPRNTLNALQAIAIAMLFFALPYNGSLKAEETLSKEDVRTIVREYLIENPEILIEVQEALEQKQQAEMAISQQQTIQENFEAIYASPYQIVFGNPEAEKTIVEFFDYNCGFCKRALEDMQQFIELDPDVRFILKEFPVLGEASLEASRVSMAFSKVMPEKYPEFHVELLSMEGLKDGARAIQLAESMGADTQKLITEMENPEILDAIQEIYGIANGLGITGTPSYIAGSEVVFGAVGYSQLKQAVESQTN